MVPFTFLCYTTLVMRTRVDLLPVTLRELRISAFHRGWIKLGMGVHMRAKDTAEGYDVRIRYGKDDVIRKSSIRVSDRPIGRSGTLRRVHLCAGCGKPASKSLYLGKDFRFYCAKCMGVPQWQIRTPINWDLGEEVRFRKLLRVKIDQDILKFELAALRALTPAEFFKTRPYLVPEWIDRIRDVDEALYRKSLKILHGKYKSVMMKRRVRYINEKQEEWLLEKLGIVIEKAFIISKKELKWLRQQRESQQQLKPLGNQLGTKSEPSSSPLTGTDTLLSRMSSGVDTSAKPAEDETYTQENKK
jgi:hypothetical protein